VLVSPSTLTMLKVSCTTSSRASFSIAALIFASVTAKHSIVAILGAIMPEPLAIIPILAGLPSSSNSSAYSFLRVSVVMMPMAAAERRGDCVAIPLPGFVDNVFIPSAIVGINEKSEKTDIAIGFLKTILSRDIQGVKLSDGFPVNVSALKDTMETEGNLMVGFMMSGMGFEGETIQAGTPSIEDQQKIMDMCLAVKTPYIVDSTLAEMVADEAKGYFAGEKDLEKTIADIRERTRIYLAE